MKSRNLFRPVDYHRLAHRCGVSIGDAMRAVIETVDGLYCVDAASPWFPHCPNGPGTELSRLLKRFGIEQLAACQCRAKQQDMDHWGPDECERPERIDEVVAVMRAEAEARGLPFLDVAGRLLVRRAIANARRNA